MALAAMAIGFMFFMLIIVILLVLGLIFWIAMIIDCAKRNFKKDSEKIVWILVLIFLGVLGAIIYYFVVKRK